MLLFYLSFHHFLYQIYELFLIDDISVYIFNSLPNGDYSNLLIVATFSHTSFSGKTSLPINIFHDKANTLAAFFV